jgi:hypothetical protein
VDDAAGDANPMALGLSISLTSIPGVSTLLQKVDSYKATFLGVPDRVNRAMDKLAYVRSAMTANGAPPSAQSDALAVQQHLQQVKDEWGVAASSLNTLQTQGLSISLDTLAIATNLITSMTYVLGNTASLESSVNALAAKYLSPQQQAAVGGGGLGGIGSLALVVGIGYILTQL